MSLYSEMTDERSPGKLTFSQGDIDYWMWSSDGRTQTLNQFIDNRSTGVTITITSFESRENPDKISWTGNDNIEVTNDYSSEAREYGDGGIYQVRQ